ncbi:MAG: hypothetical protein K2W97_05145 [Chthoniobacterales bacterium]|nr:hypothetical protein [Chthoniobacterales bacterium]
MKTKNHFAWNILLISLGCFLFTMHSSSGMFGEEFDQAKADEAARLKAQQQAEQQHRQRELTSPDNQSSDLQVDGASIATRGDLSNDGPSEQPSEEMAENESIRIIMRPYFPLLSQEEENYLIGNISYEFFRSKLDYEEDNRIFTPDAKIFSITSKLARKAGLPRPATVADAVAAYKARVSSLTEAELADFPLLATRLKSGGELILVRTQQPAATHLVASLPQEQPRQPQPSVKAAAVLLPAPVKATPVLPQQPPQESAFERQKKETLRNLRCQIDAAQRELPTHEATMSRLQPLQQELEHQKQNSRAAQQKVDDFKARFPVASRIPGTDEYYQLQALRAKRDAAASATTQSVNETFVAIVAGAKPIATLSSRIQSLEAEHTRVAASEDPIIVEKRRQEAAAARAAALERQRQREITELAQRKAAEAQLAAERAKTLALQRQQQEESAARARVLAQQQTSVKAPAVSLPAPVKATPALPPQPPQESPFERQKKETLRNLREQIAAAQRELTSHQATQDRLQKEKEGHDGRVSETKSDLEDFNNRNPLSSIGFSFGFTEHSRNLLAQKDRLETAHNNAIRAKNQFIRQNMSTLEAAKNSIATLTTRIRSLEQDHTRVAASEDPIIVEQRRQEEAAARAIRLEQQRQQQAAEGKIAGLAQRKAIEAQLAAERAKALAQQRLGVGSRESSASSSLPSTQPGGKGDSSPEQLLAKSLGSHSDGSTSGEESNHSTPEKIKTPLMTEIEQLEEQVSKIHAAVVNARDAIKIINKELWQHWDRYFELAEERSELKQRLAILKGNTPEPAFKASDKKPLLTRYSDALFEKNRFFENLNRLGTDIKNLYKRHSIHSMVDYYRNTEVQKLEQPLIQRVQKDRQWAAMQFLQAELALLAVEEHPPILQQIEECVWQNMPFSEKDRDEAVRAAYGSHLTHLTECSIALEYSGGYSGSSAGGSSSSWNPAANANQILNYRGQQQAAQQQQVLNQQNANYIYNLNRPAYFMPK